jgi:hypothetical protein
MSWKEILKQHPDRSFHFPEGQITFGQMAEELTAVAVSPFLWEAGWSPDSVRLFLSSLDSGRSVFVTTGQSPALPASDDVDGGKIYLSSSGTMGPSRWVSHSLNHLPELKPLYSGKSSGIYLKPGHAAGIEALLTGILGGNDLFFLSTPDALKELSLSVLHGPPMILAFLLNFPAKFKKFLNGLDTFYNVTDVLHPVIVEKFNHSGFDFQIEQIYGTTETWRIETETNPEHSELFRITDPRVEVRGNEIFCDGSVIGDHWIDVGDGWGKIEARRSWVTNHHGEKYNLFDLEDKILRFPGVAEVHFREKKALMTPLLEVDVLTLEDSHVDEASLKRFVGEELPFIRFRIDCLVDPTPGKLKRPGK